ncbi:MAG: hypothetical protein JW747_07580 [Candidatus Aminicenantes bacterium]|nr:hypothetical protein [Candidatus Aminicenantes bacterium]
MRSLLRIEKNRAGCLISSVLVFPGLLAAILWGPPAACGQERTKTIRAVRVESPPRIDGRLDDVCWRDVEPATDFIQYNLDLLLGYAFGAGNIVQFSYKKSARAERLGREGGHSLTLKVSYLFRL